MILFKKAMRSIWRGKRSYIACVVLMAVGISMYAAFNMVAINLTTARDKLYSDQRFADAFASVRGMPINAAERLSEIDGIEAVAAGISADARVLLENKPDKIITLRIHSFEPDEDDPLNKFLITHGSAPSENEIIIGNSFFEANGLDVGETLTLIISGKEIKLTVSGTAQSPEYVYAIPDSGQIMPDNEAFGFAFVTYAQLSTITGEQGLADKLAFKLGPDTGFDSIKYILEDELAPYGFISLFPRKDHPSAAMLNQEINSISSVSTSMPMVFIFMAVIILYIMLKRVIEQERGSIGTLKAFGFSDFEVLLHYLCYGLLTGGLGGIFGCLGGQAMSNFYTELFAEYFNLPALTSSMDPALIAVSMLISLASGALGAFMGTRSVLKLNPSEAMHPPAPPLITVDVLKSLPSVRILLASNGQMAMRNISRSKFRSLFVIIGVSFSFALIGFTASFPYMMDKMMLDQFSKVQLFDVKASLKTPGSTVETLEAVYGINGVSLAEGILELPCELRLQNRKESMLITGIAEGARLQRIYESEGEIYLQPVKGGLTISASLAGKIGASRGDTLMVKTMYTGDEEIPMPVLGIVNESIGMSAYMELSSLCMALNVPESINGVLISTADPVAVKTALENADNVSAVTDRQETRKTYDDMLASYGSMFTMMQLAGMGVAYAIITNTASISMSERKREYATLRVLGMFPREIGKILGFEYWLLTVIGIIPGIPLLGAIRTAMSQMIDVSMFTIPASVPLSSYITAAAGCLVTVGLCNLLSSRQISKFDMVEVLKERE